MNWPTSEEEIRRIFKGKPLIKLVPTTRNFRVYENFELLQKKA